MVLLSERSCAHLGNVAQEGARYGHRARLAVGIKVPHEIENPGQAAGRMSWPLFQWTHRICPFMRSALLLTTLQTRQPQLQP